MNPNQQPTDPQQQQPQPPSPVPAGPPEPIVQPQPDPTPYPQPNLQSPINPMPDGTPLAPQKKPKTALIIVGIIILIVLGIGMLFAILTHHTNTASTNSSNDVAQANQLKLLTQYGSHLQASDLTKFDKTALFYAVFQNASAQGMVGATVDRYLGSGPQDQTSRSNEFIHKSTYNYQTKQVATEFSDTKGTYFVRCVGGHYYNYDTLNLKWKMGTAQDDQTTCDAGSYVYSISDGFNTGGLSTSQANTFVSYLKSVSGLITVDDMRYVTHSGAPYIRLAVTVQPQVFPTGGYTGMGYFITAFEKTGLDPQKWPYGPVGSIATGAKIIYYIDPSTQLPAYSQVGLTYHLDDTGKNQLPNTSYDFQDTVYSFGGTVPTLSASGTPQVAKLSWPEEQISQ